MQRKINETVENFCFKKNRNLDIIKKEKALTNKKMSNKIEEQNRTLAMQRLRFLFREKSPFLKYHLRDYLRRYLKIESQQPTLF